LRRRGCAEDEDQVLAKYSSGFEGTRLDSAPPSPTGDGIQRLTIGQARDFPAMPCACSRANALRPGRPPTRPMDHSFGHLLVPSVCPLSDHCNLENDSAEYLPRSAKSCLSTNALTTAKKSIQPGHGDRRQTDLCSGCGWLGLRLCLPGCPRSSLRGLCPTNSGNSTHEPHPRGFNCLLSISHRQHSSGPVTLQHSRHFVLTHSRMQPAAHCHSR
jgi:hypothetical protein